MERVWDWLLGWVDRLRMLWKLFSGAILIYIGLDIRRANTKSITIAHKNNKKWRPRYSRSRIMTLIGSCMLHWSIDWIIIDEGWLRRDGCVLLILMGDECFNVGWILMFGVWCVLKESSKLAGWLARLAGRLLRSAVVFAPMKQYGHVSSIVVWLIHSWSMILCAQQMTPSRHS